jgi:PAS domain S-box-containing protein
MKRFETGLPLLVLAAGLGLTGVSAYRAHASQREEVKVAFDLVTRDAVNRVEARLGRYEHSLAVTRGLFQASPTVTRATFATFIASLGLDPEVQAIGYAALVPSARKEPFVAQVRRDGLPGFAIRPGGVRPDYCPVLYLEPFHDRNLRALGFDMLSEPVRLEAALRARDTGGLAMSGRVRLVQDLEVRPGFLLYLPVYRNGLPAGTPEERRKALAGYVYTALRVEDLLPGTLGAIAQTRISVGLVDGSEGGPSGGPAPTPLAARYPELASRTPIVFGGHTWTLVSQALPGLLVRHKDGAPTLLALGACVSILLWLLALASLNRFARVRRLNAFLENRVRERTQALRESEVRFHSAFRYMPVGASIATLREGRFLAVNRLFETFFGFGEEELLAHSSLAMGLWADPQDRAKVVAMIQRGEDVSSLEAQFRRKDGTLGWMAFSGHGIRLDGVDCLLSGVVDITASKAMEKALKESEFFFKESQRMGSVGSYHADFVQGRWKSSEVMDAIFGIDADFDRTIPGWLDLIHPEDRPMMGRYLEEEVIRRRKPFAREYRIVRRNDGVVRWVNGMGTGLFDEAGTFLSLTGTIQDITDRKRLELARSALFDISEATQAVSTMEELLARTHQCISTLLPARNFFVAVVQEGTGDLTFPYFVDEMDGAPQPRRRGRSLTDRVLATGEAQLLTLETITVLAAEGAVEVQGTVPHMWLGVPLLGPEGPFGVLVVQSYSDQAAFQDHDVDLLRFVSTQVAASIKRKQAQEDRAHLQAQLLQAQKMESLGILAGGVAHDMNNVLGAILALASAHLAVQPKDGPAYPAFETIRDAATRGGELVRGLLNFARQSPGERRTLDFNTLLGEEVRLLERTTLAKVRLELALAPDLRPIQGDAGALSHALMNLCVNSVDAMGEGGTLTLGTRNLNERQIEVTVRDTGCGMSSHVLAKVFDPFFTTKDVGKGTGLGLSLVYNTVKAHGGEVAVASRPGEGTLVTLRFPVAGEPEPAGDRAPRPEAGSHARPLQLLLVDDDELMLTSTRMLAEVLGHSVTCAPSGETALLVLEQGFRPDAVVLDMNMPGLGGRGTLPKLRLLAPDVPVLLATGRADQEALDFLATQHRVTLLPKPFGIEELRTALGS